MPCRSLAITLLVTLIVPLAAGAQESPGADPDRILQTLERIAVALERIERAQGQEVWLRRAEMGAIRQRELERQLGEARRRVDSLSEERLALASALERLDDLERDPDASTEQLEADRRMLESRSESLRDLLRQAEARATEIDQKLAQAERDLEDRLLDIDRQLRAP